MFTYRDERRLFAVITVIIVMALVALVQVSAARAGTPSPLTSAVTTAGFAIEAAVSATVSAVRGTGHGPVTLALVGTLASSSLTAQLSRLCQAHPGLDLRLRTALSAEVSALVLRGDAALGLRYDTDPGPGLASVIIHHERLVPVCPPGHPLAAGQTDLAAALAGQRWLAFPSGPGAPGDPYAAALQQLLAAYGLGAAETMPIDSLTAQKRLAEAGFGLAILPESSLEEELRTGTLRAIDAPALTATIPVALIRRRNAFQTGAARALTAALTDWPHNPGPAPPHANH